MKGEGRPFKFFRIFYGGAYRHRPHLLKINLNFAKKFWPKKFFEAKGSLFGLLKSIDN